MVVGVVPFLNMASTCIVIMSFSPLNTDLQRIGFDRYLMRIIMYERQCHMPQLTAFNVVLCSSTVQCSTVQYGTAQYSTVQYVAVQFRTVQYSALQYLT